MNTITIAPIDVSAVSKEDSQAVAILSEAKAIVIKTQDDYDKVGAFRIRINIKIKALDELRKSITRPLDEAKANVMNLFKSPVEFYRQAKDILDRVLISYDEKKEKERREQEEKLQREADKKRQELLAKAEEAEKKGKDDKAEELKETAANIVAPTLAPQAKKPEGISYIERWSAEVIDFKKLPDEYKLPNMPMLNKTAQATKGKIKIPGVVFKSEKIVAGRTK